MRTLSENTYTHLIILYIYIALKGLKCGITNTARFHKYIQVFVCYRTPYHKSIFESKQHTLHDSSEP